MPSDYLHYSSLEIGSRGFSDRRIGFSGQRKQWVDSSSRWTGEGRRDLHIWEESVVNEWLLNESKAERKERSTEWMNE